MNASSVPMLQATSEHPWTLIPERIAASLFSAAARRTSSPIFVELHEERE